MKPQPRSYGKVLHAGYETPEKFFNWEQQELSEDQKKVLRYAAKARKSNVAWPEDKPGLAPSWRELVRGRWTWILAGSIVGSLFLLGMAWLRAL